MPFSLILCALLLINLQSSTFFYPIYPFSSVKIAIWIKHWTISMRNSVQLLSFVSICFNKFCIKKFWTLRRVCFYNRFNFYRSVDFQVWFFRFDYFGLLTLVFIFSTTKTKNVPHRVLVYSYSKYYKQSMSYKLPKPK